MPRLFATPWFWGAVIALLAVLTRMGGWIVDGLWYDAVGHLAVFETLFLARAGLFLGGFAVATAIVWLSLTLLRDQSDLPALLSRLRRKVAGEPHEEAERKLETVFRRRLGLVALALSVLVGLLFGAMSIEQWDTLLRFVGGGAVGRVDPVFGNDIGFYLFALPFWVFLQESLAVLLFLILLLQAVVYGYAGKARFGRGGVSAEPGPLRHMAVTAAAFLVIFGLGFVLERYALLTDPTGAVFGAGWTAVNATRFVYWGAAGLSMALAAVVLWAGASNRPRSLPLLGGGYLALLAAGLLVVPPAVQGLIVKPNELEREAPYLERNIAQTRTAFDLTDLDIVEYQPKPRISLDEIRANNETIDNIRIWDWRPLKQTFRQLQQIRAYYQFNDVDVGRYEIGGKTTQVMLSARELSGALPGKSETWVNRQLQFTHGYGLAMAPTAEKDTEGAPRLIVRDLPPVTPKGLEVERPAIYYGETMGGYRIVDTGVREFDYPKGDDNVYASYDGDGGVSIAAPWRRALFAWETGDLSILLTDYITDDSLIQYNRTVTERLDKLVPFLTPDSDPYLVVADGGLYWMVDAYATTDAWPYSEPHASGVNYIRNAAKIVIDAHDGDVRVFTADPDDPVTAAYRRLFPGLFEPLDAMPSALRKHVRYPLDMFGVQVDRLSTYHMTVPQVFYNREDVWTRPKEKYGGETIPVQPYFILMDLPGGEIRLEYLLMTALTPANRDNMIAWVGGRSDPPHYGELVLYKLPKERLIKGPIQIEATIDQDPVISRQLSLWDQRGSSVTRGNLIIIPIGEAFLYVEPVYLVADGTQIPQLKRVIVSNGETVAMEPTLDEALRVVFGDKARTAPRDDTAPTPRRPETLDKARQSLKQALDALQAGDWAGFGENIEALRRQLED